MSRILQFVCLALAGAVVLSSCTGSSVEQPGTLSAVPQTQALPEAVGSNATFKEYSLPDGEAAGPGTIVSGHLLVPADQTYVYNITSGGTASLVALNAPALCDDYPLGNYTCEYPKAATASGAFVWVLDTEQTPNVGGLPGVPLSQAVLFAVNPTTGAIVRELADNLGNYQETPGENVVQGADLRLWYTECENQGNPDFSLACYVVGSSFANGGTAYYTGTSIGKALASGYDGRLYLTEGSTGAADVARITTSGRVIHRYPLPTGSDPIGIASGCDHNLWIVLDEANKIARLSISGAMTEYTIPTPHAGAIGIRLGVDGNMWFTEYRANKIGRITSSGAITEYNLPVSIRGPSQIIGPYAGNCPHLAHGYFWITEAHRSAIGNLSF